MGTREKLHVSSKAQSTLPKIQLVEGWGKNANPSSGVVRGATNQPWWWGSGENTIPSSGKVDGDTNSSPGERKHKSSIVVEWWGARSHNSI